MFQKVLSKGLCNRLELFWENRTTSQLEPELACQKAVFERNLPPLSSIRRSLLDLEARSVKGFLHSSKANKVRGDENVANNVYMK